MGLFEYTRRELLKVVSTSAILSPLARNLQAGRRADDVTSEGKEAEAGSLPLGESLEGEELNFSDGPKSDLFNPLEIKGNTALKTLDTSLVSESMVNALGEAPQGRGVLWGIPFHIGENIILLKNSNVSVRVVPFKAEWILFLHTSDVHPLKEDLHGFFKIPFRGQGKLAEHMADYILIFSDGSEARAQIKRRHQIGMFQRSWGENNILSVADHKPHPVRAHHEQRAWGWGGSQTRVNTADRDQWVNWLWAWENPHPNKSIKGFRLEPKKGTVILSAICTGQQKDYPAGSG